MVKQIGRAAVRQYECVHLLVGVVDMFTYTPAATIG